MSSTVSQTGLDLIAEFEGLELNAYPDPGTGAEPITIGIGTTYYHDGTKVRIGDTISEAEAYFELSAYIEKEILSKLHKVVLVELEQNQVDAIVSLCYNIGFSAFSKSTLLRKINQSDWVGCQENFLKWNRAANKPMRGLTRRRLREAELFGPLNRNELIDVYLNGNDPEKR